MHFAFHCNCNRHCFSSSQNCCYWNLFIHIYFVDCAEFCMDDEPMWFNTLGKQSNSNKRVGDNFILPEFHAKGWNLPWFSERSMCYRFGRICQYRHVVSTGAVQRVSTLDQFNIIRWVDNSQKPRKNVRLKTFDWYNNNSSGSLWRLNWQRDWNECLTFSGCNNNNIDFRSKRAWRIEFKVLAWTPQSIPVDSMH